MIKILSTDDYKTFKNDRNELIIFYKGKYYKYCPNAQTPDLAVKTSVGINSYFIKIHKSEIGVLFPSIN